MAPCDHHHKAKSPTSHLREEHDVILEEGAKGKES